MVLESFPLTSRGGGGSAMSGLVKISGDIHALSEMLP